MVTALKILAVAGAIRTLGSVALIMFEGVGQPHIATRFGAVKLGVMLVTIVPLITSYGIDGAAMASLLASGVVAVLVLPKIRTFSHGRFSEFVRSIAWPLVNSLVMGLAMLAVRTWSPTASAFGTLLMALFAGGVTYLLATATSSRFFGYGQPRQLLAILRQRSATAPIDDSDFSD